MTTSRPELVLIRHGETEWSASRRHTGRTDIELTDRGREQAQAIAAAVADIDFTTVLASPLRRAWDTAVLAGLTPTVDDGIVEWDYGDYEGITTATVRETTPGWSVWTHPITGGESVDDVGARADAAIERYTEHGGTIGIVAHAHFLRILAARWLGLDAREGRRFVLDTATLSLLSWERENRVVRRWNDPCGW
ncbi:MAG: histidine phosphatase family protein [Ilumatobacter sp.]|nr:histidine phosphatase family protein [Ilumatobacter sp.]